MDGWKLCSQALMSKLKIKFVFTFELSFSHFILVYKSIPEKFPPSGTNVTVTTLTAISVGDATITQLAVVRICCGDISVPAHWITVRFKNGCVKWPRSTINLESSACPQVLCINAKNAIVGNAILSFMVVPTRLSVVNSSDTVILLVAYVLSFFVHTKIDKKI